MRDTLEVELAVSALRMACDARRPTPGLIHHSDRGSQYAAPDYRTELAAHQMRASMSRKGDCYDNAVAERFFATLEFELIMRSNWTTKDAARRAIVRYIEKRGTIGNAGTPSWGTSVRRVRTGITGGRVVAHTHASTNSG